MSIEGIKEKLNQKRENSSNWREELLGNKLRKEKWEKSGTEKLLGVNQKMREKFILGKNFSLKNCLHVKILYVFLKLNGFCTRILIF